MDSSSSKVDAIKPVLFKAGIPLAVTTIAGFVLARITTPKPPPQTQVNITRKCLPEDILGRIKDMEDRELQLEKKFLQYQGLKDQQLVLMDLRIKMMLEMNRIEYLEREVLLVEAENKRFQKVANDYLKIFRLEEFLKSENEQLRRRAKKLLKRNKEHSQTLRKQCCHIQRKDREIARSEKELEEKRDEIKDLKLIIEQLQGEKKNELSAAPKVEGEKVSIEDYNRVIFELEQLQKHEASQVEELIYLKWSNARLKQMRRSQEHAANNGFGEIEELGSDNELNHRTLEQGDSYFGLRTHDHARSRRRKLIEKFKRWVEGGEKTKQSSKDEERHGNKCFPRHFVSDGAEDAYIHARKSCSSV